MRSCEVEDTEEGKGRELSESVWSRNWMLLSEALKRGGGGGGGGGTRALGRTGAVVARCCWDGSLSGVDACERVVAWEG